MPHQPHPLPFWIGLAVILASSVFLHPVSVFPADQDSWSHVSRRVLLEAKPGRWQAQWIAPGEDLSAESISRVFYLRKAFTVEDPASFQRVYVSADSKYKMWINGVPAARGPQRYDPNHQRYDTLDLSALVHKGENVMAVEVMYWGAGGPIFQMSVRPAFVLESAALQSDQTWKTWVSPAIDTAGMSGLRRGLGYIAGNWLEKVDARLLPAGWNQPDYDESSWLPAREIGRAEAWGDGDTRMPWKLLPRTIHPMEEREPEPCRAIQSGIVQDSKEFPPFAYEVQPDGVSPSLPYTIPADGHIHYLVFDAGRLVTGYPMLDLEGTQGAVVEIMYAEAPSLNRKKDRRDRLDDKRVEGFNDVYILRDGRQTYEPFLHRTFWYVRVAVKTDQPLTIHGLRYRWTSYDFRGRGWFSCSDPLLNQIWNTGLYTLRMCSHETYEDCPYYEMLQYVGDTRIQALVTYLATGDTTLPANAIRQIGDSRLPEGLTYSRYPSHVYQIIPGFSLIWVLMVDDYYQYTGDKDLPREMAAGIYSVLRFFEKYQTDKGFIANLPYWNFHDWKFERGGSPPASQENCTLTTLLYKGALDAGARIFEAIGDPHEAARFRERSAAVADAINRYAWSEAEGLYTDGVEIKSLSQHVNIYAILYGVAGDAQKERIAQRLFDDTRLRDTTFYFAHYLHQAARQLGQPGRVIKDLARWKSMLDMGTSTWWEQPGQTRSDCHAWSATPTFTLMQMVLGVQPAAPGYQKVLVQPYPGDLQWAQGIVPTPHGDIKVKWNAQPRFTIKVVIPEGIEAEVILPSGAQSTVSAGEHTVMDEE